ncbi:MAG: hypothetical protein CTY34_07720 [Methylobacter sp.]|nr:MAG: hypothetical protein CTY34_07720 [Methylobacter sp.]
MAWINARINDDGLRLLRVLAMYPKLEPALTLALFKHLTAAPIQRRLHANAAETLSPATLLKTITLPWCRQGWLPLWLRQALLKNIDNQDYNHCRQFFLRLFDNDSPALNDASTLAIQKPMPFWQRIPLIQHLRQQAGYSSPLRDTIFTQILLFPHNPIETMPLAKRMLKNLPNAIFSVWGSILAMMGVFCLCMTGVYGLWQWQGENWVGQQLLQPKLRQHNAITVLIRYRSEAKALSDLMAAGMSAVGYKVAAEIDEKLVSNRLIAPADLLGDLQATAVYLSWGSQFSQFSQGSNFILEVANMPQTGQSFRDERPLEPNVKTNYPEPEKIFRQQQPQLDVSQPIVPKMISIAAGQFMMGSAKTENPSYDDEKPQHLVKLAAFQLAATELTFDEWEVCVNAKVCPEANDRGWGRGSHPVIYVSWHDAKTYIQWLNQRLKLTGENAYRLPTEAEWEYAARAGTQTPYYWGDADIDAYAWYSQNSNGKTQAVGQKTANAWGLYDMSGNVWEWVEDCWHESYENAPSDGSAWLDSNAKDCERSVRGGSWFVRPENLRSANRYWNTANGAITGFRLARTH